MGVLVIRAEVGLENIFGLSMRFTELRWYISESDTKNFVVIIDAVSSAHTRK